MLSDYKIGYAPNTGLLGDSVRGGFMNDQNQASLGLELKLPFINWKGAQDPLVIVENSKSEMLLLKVNTFPPKANENPGKQQ